jgi:hypothetical protein
MKSHIKNPFSIRKSLDIIFQKSLAAYPFLENFEVVDESNIMIDTQPIEFGTISLRYKINDDDLKDHISKEIGDFKKKNEEKPPNNIDVDTIWISCSTYFDYGNGEIDDPICHVRNGFQYPLTDFVPEDVYDEMEDGIVFVIENTLLHASRNIEINEIEAQLQKILNKKDSFWG